MRTLTQSALNESLRYGQNVAWVLSIQWPAGTAHYAHRTVTLPGGTLSAALKDSGRLISSRESGIGPAARPASSRLRISLTLDGPESPSVRERLAACDPEGLEVRWGLLFLDPAGAGNLEDWIPLFWGVVERAVVTRVALELDCLDMLSARGRERFGRELCAADLPEPGSAAEGRMLPWIFGAPGQVELIPWRTGRSLALVHDVEPRDTAIALQSVDNLPETGVVQIGDERLEYDALDPTAKTLGSPAVPLRRTEPGWHDAGSPARLLPPGGFEWLVAGHPCRVVRNLLSDGLPVAEGLYAVTTEAWQGETVQKAVLPKWPTQIAYRPDTHTLRLNGESQPGVWGVESSSTALNALFALDAYPHTTRAEISVSAKSLVAGWLGDLSGAEQRYGQFAAARLIALVEAEQIWEPSTQLNLTFENNEISATATLPRPDPASLDLVVPSHTHGSEGEPSGPLTAALRYGPVEFVLDLTDLLTQNGGWTLLEGRDETGFVAKIEMESSGDPVRFFVYDLRLEIAYRPRARTLMARRLTADVEGVSDGGLLLDNPSDLARFFLCDPHALGLSPSNLDEASFAAAGSHLQDLGYRFSNRLSEPESLTAILQRILFEARCRLVSSGGKLLLRFDAGEGALSQPDFTFDGETILQSGPLRLDRNTQDRLLRAVHLHYGRDFSGLESSAAQAAFLWSDSVLPRPACARAGSESTARLHWHNHGDPAVVADLARALLGRYGFRAERIRVSAPFRAIALEPQDRVALRDDSFPLDLDQGRVDSVWVPEPHIVSVETLFAVCGPVCWRHDNQTFLRHRDSGRLLEIWIGGVLAATVQWDGLWRLRGTVTEGVTFYGALSDPVFYRSSEGRLYFGTGGGGSYMPRVALDSSGNLLVNGSVTEGFPRADIVLQSCIEASAAHFAKGIEESLPVFVYDVATSTLQVRGTLAEKERFY